MVQQNLEKELIMKLYIETNFLMSIATGRDDLAFQLLENPPASVKIAIPSICCLEALSALEDEIKRRNRFENELNLQISQLRRDKTSLFAKSLLSLLEQSLSENRGFVNDIEFRLFQAMAKVAETAEIIELTNNILRESLSTKIITKEPTDNLIIHAILEDAKINPTETKVFLSGNIKEFGTIQDLLNQGGITRYFTNCQEFFSWFNNN